MANKFRLTLTIFFGVLTFLFFSGLLPSNQLSLNAQEVSNQPDVTLAQDPGCMDLSICRVGDIVVWNKEITELMCCDLDSNLEGRCGYRRASQ